MTCYRKYCPRVVIFCIFFAPNNYLFNEAKKQIKTNLSPLKISCYSSITLAHYCREEEFSFLPLISKVFILSEREQF